MKKYYIFTIIIAVFVALAACRGNQQSKLIGSWKRVYHTNPDSTETSIWDFYDGDKLEVTTTSLSGADTIIEYAYVIDGKNFSIFTPSSNPNWPYYEGQQDIRGEYWVDELEKSNFKVTKRSNPLGESGGVVYIRIELVKK